MDRYEKYGSGAEILERVREASPYFTSLNVDMIFNFPAQTEDILINDIERVVESGTSQTTFYPAHGVAFRGALARPARSARSTMRANSASTISLTSCLPAATTPCSITAAPGRSTSAKRPRQAGTP